MKKYIFLLCCLFSQVSQIIADEAEPIGKPSDANIFGHVVDAKDNEHIPFFTIGIRNTTIGTLTDATGHFSLKNLPEGTFTVVAEGIGYKTQEQKVTLKKGISLEVNFTLERDALKLDEVVVTAGRGVQKRTEAPVIVNTLSTQLLQSTQSTVLGEGLNFCTGLRYENDCQNCGFSQVRMNGLEGPYSQILINSRPVFSGLAGVYGLELIPANMLERIEVVRGGGSVLYGSNAIAGTINLIMKDPKSNTFEAGFSNSLIGTGVSNSNGPKSDYVANFNASLVTDDHRAGIAVFGNMRDRKMFDANDDDYSEIAPMKNTVIGTRIFYRPAYRNKLSLDFFNISEKRDGGNKQDYPLHERDVAEAVSHDMKVGALTFEQYFRESDLLSVFASGQYLNRDSYYGANKSLSDYGNTVDKTYSLGAQYKMIFENSSLIGGVEHTGSHLKDKKLGYPDYDNAEIGPNFNGTQDSIYSIPHVDNTTVSDQSLTTTGVFAQYEIKFGKLKLLGGARFEHYSVDDKGAENSDKSGNVFVPRASAMYDITPFLQTRLGFSRGYRAPQIFDEDLHIETSGSRRVINRNDPGLKQENSTSWTLSFDFNKSIGSVYTGFLIEGFYTKLHNPFRNEIGEPDENGTVIYTRVNSKGGAVVQGFNIEVKLLPRENISINGGFTVQSSRYKEAGDFDEKKFFRTPNTYGFLALDWDFLPKFCLSATGNYTGKMLVPYFGPNTDPVEGELRKSKNFFDAGVKLSYNMKIASGVNVQWFGGVKNIFNSYQSDFDKGIDRDPSYIYGPSLPRTVYFGFKIGNLL
ncbi:TonB-dependent receptor [Dysgonomonas sp. 520]|uniref:TonB-dependent receptor n=1 Tax=Dysgonomonas sp. 520 TaxID=2302931 RepID=UPI0013D07611|nr:TonB-dependent receptor [Dysgonomonas sp. 520]NDW10031.1 TonB-dependent receptor [Dysgonomonas sp. 520]